MELPEKYVAANKMQRRDAQDVIEEFSCELSKMRGKCLDIGSGPGDITKEMLLPLLPHDAEIIGADISQTMVNYANEKHSDEKRLSYIMLDIETELPNCHIEQYDNAVSFYCLHWCNDMWRAFENIYKLLRPDGKAIVMFLGYHSGFEAYLKLKENPHYEHYFQDARRYVPYFQRMMCKDIRASLRKMLEDIGFKILHCSKREKTFQYTRQSLKNHVCAIVPFIKEFPDEVQNDLTETLVTTITNQNVLTTINTENAEREIVLKYYLLVAHMQKPSTASSV